MTGNKNWPGFFIRKPGQRAFYEEGTSSHYDESNSPDRKRRWIPKPEQIQILEDIFNSGMTNPPRDEIAKITIQLQEFGEVGEASIYYWFQNRKSKTKKKQSHDAAERSKSTIERTATDQYKAFPATTTTDSESSSSAMPPASLSTHQDHHFYGAQTNEGTEINLTLALGTGVIIDKGQDSIYNRPITVFINNSKVEVPMGPINVKAFFGENAILINSSGVPMLINEAGFTMQGLQHGATYYLV